MINFKQFKYLLETEDPKDKDKEQDKKPAGREGKDPNAKMEPEKGKFQTDMDHENPDITFDKEAALVDAEKWLVARYGDELYNFLNVPNMDMESEIVKTYSIVVSGRAYTINLRRFEGLPDGSDKDDGADKGMVKDTIGYDILAPQIAPPEPEEPEQSPDEL